MTKKNSYWQERFDQIEQAQNNKSVKYTKNLEKKYQQAASEIDAQINKWYNRIAKNNEISMTEARRLLSASELKEFKWSVEEYIAYGRQNAINQQWMKELENASAKFHINRLEAMKLECRHQIERAMASGQQDMFDMLGDVYKDTFYRSCYEVQKGIGIGFDVAKLDDNAVSKLLNKPWAADGTNFSQKLWGNKTKLINTLDQELSRMVLTGDTPNRAIRNIRDAMNSSMFQAKRLVLTEQAYFTSEAQKKTFGELDVEEFEVVSSTDLKVCPVCAAHDKKHHPMAEFHIGITAPPFHPLCRCVTAPFFDDEFTSPTRWVTGVDGERYEIPATMNYGEWKKSFVDGGNKKKYNKADYIVRNHIGVTDIEDERKVFESAFARVPVKVQNAINNGTVIDIGQIGASEYDYGNDILYIAKGADETASIHEIGHAVENKMCDARTVAALRKKIVGDPTIWDITTKTYYDASGNPIDIFILQNSEFISEYQGRIYVDNIADAFEDDGEFIDEYLEEFISEPFREYIENPEGLKSKNMELYNFIKGVVE